MSVIEKILKLMEQERVSAKKLTTDLGLANSSISEWKKGKARPSLEAVIKIAGYFHVTTDFLLLDQEDQEDTSESTGHSSEAEAQKEEEEEDWEAVKQLPGDARSLLECYYRLDEKDREYIRSKMIVLERESMN